MLITSFYEKDSKTDKAWFESSNVFYSEFIEDNNENKGDLLITFNNGSTYKYKDVLIAPDYLLFKFGDIEGSHGKALNKIIKPKYEFERMDNQNISDLIKERDLCIRKNKEAIKNKTYFISGHRDINEDEFNRYKTEINKILEEQPDALFIVGDYGGVDILAQNYIIDELGVNPEQITVYHMFDEPRNINPKIMNKIGGFQTDEERDSAMTNNSFKDIAFVKNHKKLSGTAQNILRRNLL